MDGDGLAGIIGLVVRVQPPRCEGTNKGIDDGILNFYQKERNLVHEKFER